MTDAPVPAADYKGKPEEAVWLPDVSVARIWSEYVRTGAAADSTPPPAPFDVRVTKTESGELSISWNAHADFESGIQAFLIERNGKPLGQIPPPSKGKFGRPLFQAMSYHDTPEKPIPKMVFIDSSPEPSGRSVYRIIGVNSTGLKSEPSAPAALP